MKRSYKAFLAAAALAASLSLTGCGLPTFVYAQCEMALMGTMADSQIDSLNVVQNNCGTTFKAATRINQCVAEGVSILGQAKGRTMNTFRDQCAEYVEKTVCVEGSKCHKSADKITQAMAAPAIKDYVATNHDALSVRIRADLDANIKDIITKDYNSQFAKRVVPIITQAQCGNEIDNQLANFPSIAINAINRVMDACRSSGLRKQCQDAGLMHIQQVERNMKHNLKMQCAKAAIEAVCPKGSPCGLETSTADTEKTAQAAVNFMWREFNTWKNRLEARLNDAASKYRPNYPRLFAEFALPGQGNGMLSFVSIAAVVGGLGCVIAVVRLARKRSTYIQPSQDLVLLEVEEDLE